MTRSSESWASGPLHTLVPDGVFAPDATGALRFERALAPTDREVARLLATIVTRVDRLLRRRGLAPDDDTSAPSDPMAEDAPLKRLPTMR